MTTISSSIENPLKRLARFGQSIWLDYIRRSLMTSGELRRLVEQDGLGGMTSNPSIFEKAIVEARRLWKTVDRPNVMIKVPGTAEGLPAIETLLTEGINVNVTLLFSQERYEEVAWAFVRALEHR